MADVGLMPSPPAYRQPHSAAGYARSESESPCISPVKAPDEATQSQDSRQGPFWGPGAPSGETALLKTPRCKQAKMLQAWVAHRCSRLAVPGLPHDCLEASQSRSQMQATGFEVALTMRANPCRHAQNRPIAPYLELALVPC